VFNRQERHRIRSLEVIAPSFGRLLSPQLQNRFLAIVPERGAKLRTA